MRYSLRELEIASDPVDLALGQSTDQDARDKMKDDSPQSRESSPSRESDVETADDGRGRLLTRIPGTVRCSGRRRTLRHTGPSIHIWLQKQKEIREQTSLRGAGIDIASLAHELKLDRHGAGTYQSPFSGSSLSSENLEVLKESQLGAIRDIDKHLSPSDDGVTVTKILTPQGSPDSGGFIHRHDWAPEGNQAPGMFVMSRTPRPPSPANAGMRYAALWEWICSDAVLTTRVGTGLVNPKPPGRFVEYESFAARYIMLDSNSRRSDAACGTRTDE